MQRRGVLLFFLFAAFFVSALYASAEKPGDYNNDGCVTQDDYNGFSVAYSAGDLAANLDGNGVVDLEDFFYFSGLIEQDKECSAQNIPTEKTASSFATEPLVEESRLQEPALEEPLEDTTAQGSGVVEGQSLVQRFNQYYELGEASCQPGSVSADCDADSCVDCEGKCVLSGQVLAGYQGEYAGYNNQYGCFKGKWDECDSEDDLGRLRPGINGDGTFLCTSVDNHLEWVSCTSGIARDVYTLSGKSYTCKDTGWNVEDGDEGDDEDGSAGMISVPSVVVLQARPLGNGEISLSWTRSEIVEEALTGKLVLNKISGGFAINELTGKIGFIDSILDFFRGIFGMKAKAGRISGDEERGVFYKVLKQDAFGNFKVVAEVEDKDCGEECSYTDKQAERVVSYQVEACYKEICKASQVVSVDAVVHAAGVDAGVDAGVGGGAYAGKGGAGEVSSESTETKIAETQISSQISCNPVVVFQEASSLLGDAGAFQAAWQEKVVPCCREVNAARENGRAVEESWMNACAGVKAG